MLGGFNTTDKTTIASIRTMRLLLILSPVNNTFRLALHTSHPWQNAPCLQCYGLLTLSRRLQFPAHDSKLPVGIIASVPLVASPINVSIFSKPSLRHAIFRFLNHSGMRIKLYVGIRFFKSLISQPMIAMHMRRKHLVIGLSLILRMRQYRPPNRRT